MNHYATESGYAMPALTCACCCGPMPTQNISENPYRYCCSNQCASEFYD